MAINFGVNETNILDSNVRLINVTWKNSDLWILSKKDTTNANTYYFKEKSNDLPCLFGALPLH